MKVSSGFTRGLRQIVVGFFAIGKQLPSKTLNRVLLQLCHRSESCVLFEIQPETLLSKGLFQPFSFFYLEHKLCGIVSVNNNFVAAGKFIYCKFSKI